MDVLIIAGVCFLVGSFLMIGGIRIIRNKRFFTILKSQPGHFPPRYELPKLVAGKSAVRDGIGYVIYGVLLILFSLVLFYAAR